MVFVVIVFSAILVVVLMAIAVVAKWGRPGDPYGATSWWKPIFLWGCLVSLFLLFFVGVQDRFVQVASLESFLLLGPLALVVGFLGRQRWAQIYSRSGRRPQPR